MILTPLTAIVQGTTTQPGGSNNTSLATTAYVDRLLLPSGVWMKEDFLGGASLASVTTATSATFDLGWSTAQIVGGTQTVAVNSGTYNNPGLASMVTSAVSGQGITVYRGGGTNSAGPFGALGSFAGWEVNFVFQIPATTLICIRIGVVSGGQQAVDPPTNGMYMEYDTANTGNTDARFTYVTRAASSPTYSITNAVVADTNFHKVRMWSTVAGTINFSTDGGATTSISSTISANAMAPFMQVISRTTATKTLNVDYYSYQANTTRT